MFANIAAKSAELPTEIVIAVQRNCHLVTQIQKRLVRILCSIPKTTRKTLEPKPCKIKPVALEQVANKSKHKLIWDSTKQLWRCTACGAFCHKSAETARVWLQATCYPLPSDANGPVQIPVDTPHLVGGQIPHASHALYFYRGFTFCFKCGTTSAIKSYKTFPEECTLKCTVQTAAQRTRLLSMKHPQDPLGTQGKEWPLHTTTHFGDVRNCS